ncbi:RidA family protein [Rhizohabitans arisaemae]|uniref:RidA family protein n=1 Tax=Rhizohabitans arisaemae TaxID=2720610 RepID=UPI0024B0D74F|nr:RidA family protein [Rhizohabitans arisaemae]
MAIQRIDTIPSRAAELPYAPAVKVDSPVTMYFLGGATALPLYHNHPHVPEECVLPDDIVEQTHRVMRNIQGVLEHLGLTWRNVVKTTEYITDIRDADLMHATMDEYYRGWTPAATMVAVNNLSAPGCRFELDAIAVGPPTP